MTESNPNACREETADERAQRLAANLERSHERVRDLEAKLDFAQRERPRTITLEYMPLVPYEDDDRLPENADRGGHWTITEAGRAMPALDSRECLALVAAMLLGAPHPGLRSVMTMQRETSREAGKRRRAEGHIAALNSAAATAAREHQRLQDRLGSLPWYQARELLAGAKPRPGVPSNPEGPDLFRILLCELEDYRHAEELERRGRDGIAEVTAATERVIEATFGDPPAEFVDAAAAEQDAELRQICLTLEIAGFNRTPHEVRAWPVDWRVDAQNFAFAWRAWADEGTVGGLVAGESDWCHREPTAPWFLTGAPEPKAEEETADACELYVDGEAVERVPLAFAVTTPPRGHVAAVPDDAVRGAPIDPDDAFLI